ncbi:DM13 domain-containing protein [Streptomyces sp. NPDC058659]|uniref:DM13 domain-containing protein n=1 Tax=unclassified Streptomyces TaxID=2593676 RepID=UPI00365B45AD
MGRVVRKKWWAGAAVLGAAVLVAGLMWFKPWALWVDETVHEALPTATATGKANATGKATEPATPAGPATSATPAGPTTVSEGTFISHEHTTSGTVKLIRLSDGSHTVRLENLDTSNGPDLRVWLTDAPVKEGTAGWRVFDDGTHVALGKLKGNRGDQNYAVPADVDLTGLTSVTIWCDRFDVSFGAAELA